MAEQQTDTESFAAKARAATAAGPEAPSAKSQAESAAYAKALRDRVKPPPKKH